MRARDLLLENEATYMAMFNPFLAPMKGAMRSLWTNRWKDEVKKARLALKRQDRIVWYLRWVRLDIAARQVMDHDMGHGHKEHVELFKELVEQWATALGFPNGTQAHSAYTRRLEGNMVELKHFAQHPAEPIQSIVWGKQKPNDLLDKLHKIEEEWRKGQDELIDHHQVDVANGIGVPTVFIQINKEWAWYDLGQHFCPREAEAMGHCGNEGGNAQERIISLRRHVRGSLYRPSLTFILDVEGQLGEMKGRGNEKPAERYHEAIKTLLMDKRIHGITGGGYLPENNFEITDLPREDMMELLDKKPSLIGPEVLCDLLQVEDENSPRFAELLTKELGYIFDNYFLGPNEDLRRMEFKSYSREEWMDNKGNLTPRLRDFFTKNGLALDARFHSLFNALVHEDIRYIYPIELELRPDGKVVEYCEFAKMGEMLGPGERSVWEPYALAYEKHAEGPLARQSGGFHLSPDYLYRIAERMERRGYAKAFEDAGIKNLSRFLGVICGLEKPDKYVEMLVNRPK